AVAPRQPLTGRRDKAAPRPGRSAAPTRPPCRTASFLHAFRTERLFHESSLSEPRGRHRDPRSRHVGIEFFRVFLRRAPNDVLLQHIDRGRIRVRHYMSGAPRVTSNKGIDMAELSTGQVAPEFDLPRDGGGNLSLSELRG